MSNANVKEYQLIQYTPLQCTGVVPPVLPPCTEKLPVEKRAELVREREDKRKRQTEANKAKKKSVFGTIGSAVASVATAATDAITSISEDFLVSQAPGAEARFRKYFPGFPMEKLLGEYETRLVVTPEEVRHGRCYITSSFVCFHSEGRGKYILVMLPLKGIQSIQKAVVTQPPPGIPAHYPPQFHVVLGGQLALSEDVDLPKVNALVIYTQDNMQHMFFDFRYFDEMYNVLDHAWRDPAPQYTNVAAPAPEYSTVEFVSKSTQQQMEAYNAIAQFKQAANAHLAQQQQQFQQIPADPNTPPMGGANEFQGFLEQQHELQQEPSLLYPVLG